MANEFYDLNSSWWNSVEENVCCSFDNSPVSSVTLQESYVVQSSDNFSRIQAEDSSLQLSISGFCSSSVDHWAQSLVAENSEPYSYLHSDPISTKSAINNIPLFSPSGFSIIDNFVGFGHKSQQQENSSEQRNFSNKNINSINNGNSDFCSLIKPLQFMQNGFEENSEHMKSNAKLNSEETISSSYSSRSKKHRIATPSPLPTFKVRKEKLGDRITALQQLVSPFGKTDTASVLYEAIEYIKFLHEQVRTLSSPYLRKGSQINHQQNSERLKSRGLCLVPISSTFAVACSEIPPMDFWTPAFGMISYT